MGPGSPTDATAPRDLGPDSDEAALRWTFEVAETGRRAGRSPGTVKNKLHLIDQNDAIYRVNGNKNVQKVFDIDQASDGLALDNRQAVLNIAPGPSQIPTPMPITTVKIDCAMMARIGEYQVWWMRPREAGSTWSRPIENITRTVVL